MSSIASSSLSSLNDSLDCFRRRLQELLASSRFLRNSSTRPRELSLGNLAASSSSSSSGISLASTMMATESSISFTCSVCLETLDQPASIDLEQVRIPNTAVQSGSSSAPILIDVELSELNEPLDFNSAVIGGGGRPCRPSGGGRGRRLPVIDSNADRRTVVATTCGHLYHEVCLLKWFRDSTGKRSCPGCRKPVPNSKIIRLYPGSSLGSDASCTTQNVPGQISSNVPSTSSGSSGAIPGAARNGDCEECQDKTVVHNTLIKDYDELQQRNRILEDGNTLLRNNEGLKDAQIQSLVEDNNRKEAQLAQLQKELDIFRGNDCCTPVPAAQTTSLRRSTRKITVSKRFRKD